jgi:hypothetical protein
MSIDPKAINKCPSKHSNPNTLWFPQFCPPQWITTLGMRLFGAYLWMHFTAGLRNPGSIQ